MTTLSERLRLALAGPPPRTQAALARACGIKPPSVSDWFSGKTQAIEGANLLRAAAFLGVSPHWLATGKGPMRFTAATGEVQARHPDDPPTQDSVLIKESVVRFAAGDGFQITYELIEESEPATYRLSWLQREGLEPELLRRFKVSGDSMEPFLYDGDTVLVNLAEGGPRILDGKVYALRYGDDLRIKRLFRRLDGSLILRSDNRAYADEIVEAALADEHITVLGRVRDKSGTGGL